MFVICSLVFAAPLVYNELTLIVVLTSVASSSSSATLRSLKGSSSFGIAAADLWTSPEDKMKYEINKLREIE